MDFALNDEQELFRTSIRQYLESKGDLTIPRNYMEGKVKVLDEIWQGLGELGYMGITVPESYGGLGFGDLTLVPILEELGRMVIPGPYPETVAFAVPLIVTYGSEEQKKKYLPDIAVGKRKVTVALFEEGGEISPSNVQMRAKEEGEDYIVDGQKILVPHADIADTIIIPVRTGGVNSEFGITLMMVDCQDVSIEFHPQKSIDGTRNLVKITLKDVIVPKSQVLGPIHSGWPVLQKGIYHLSAAWSSTMVGGMERTVKMATDYANAREQFGQPIGRFQAVKHKIVNMKLDLECARSLSYYASWAVENEAEDMIEAVSLAASYNSEAFIRVAGSNIQVHGGMGFTWEFDCHLFLKRARSLENQLGSPETHREKAANEMGW